MKLAARAEANYSCDLLAAAEEHLAELMSLFVTGEARVAALLVGNGIQGKV